MPSIGHVLGHVGHIPGDIPFEFGEGPDDLPGQVLRASDPTVFGSGGDHPGGHHESIPAGGQVAVVALGSAAQIDAQDTTLRDGRDEPAHPIRGLVRIDMTDPAAAPLGEDQHGVTRPEYLGELCEYGGGLLPWGAPRRRADGEAAAPGPPAGGAPGGATLTRGFGTR